MTRKIGLTYTWTFTVHDAAGALSNADALPAAAVYEDDTDASVDTPTVEQIGVLTGHYRVITYLDPLIYTADHSYNVMVTMAVGGVSMGARVESFVAETANQTDILTTLNGLISTPHGLITVETEWVVGNLPTGLTVTINVYNSAGLAELLTDQTCDEFIDGFYRWSTSNMTTYPATVGLYYWVMKDDHDFYVASGMAAIGTPADVATVVEDAVWDAARADHLDAGSMGETMTDAQAVVESLDEMIEDDGGGLKRFTEKALEEGPGTDPADIFAYVPTGLEPAGSIAERTVDITDNTDRVDGLIEDDGLGADRFTAKALEEAPATPASGLWEYVPTGLEPAGSAAELLTETHDNTDRVDGLIEDDGLGADRLTAKALEEAPATPAADMWAYVPTGAEPANSVAERMVDIDDNVGVPIALDGGDATIAGMLVKMADNNAGADFNPATDSLHEIAISGAGLTAQAVWEYVLTGKEPKDSAGKVLLSIEDLVESLNNLSESDIIRIMTALLRKRNPNGGFDV